jgi:hypothetical protein
LPRLVEAHIFRSIDSSSLRLVQPHYDLMVGAIPTESATFDGSEELICRLLVPCRRKREDIIDIFALPVGIAVGKCLADLFVQSVKVVSKPPADFIIGKRRSDGIVHVPVNVKLEKALDLRRSMTFGGV